MVKNVGLILIFLLLSFAGLKAQDWYRLESPACGFRCEFPGMPAESSQQIESQIGYLMMHMFQYDASTDPGSENIMYMVNYTEYPDSLFHITEPDRLDSFYRHAIDGVAANTQGMVLSESPVTIAQYPGREVKISLQSGQDMVSARLLLVINKFYMYLVIYESDKQNNPSVAKFFQSFHLLKEDNEGTQKELN